MNDSRKQSNDLIMYIWRPGFFHFEYKAIHLPSWNGGNGKIGYGMSVCNSVA